MSSSSTEAIDDWVLVPEGETDDWADRSYVLERVTKRGSHLKHASEELKADKEVVWAAVKSSKGFALKFASEKLRADKDIVLAAVKSSYGKALKFASDKLRADVDFVLTAMELNCDAALEFASEKLKTNQDFVLAAMKSDRDAAMEFASEELKSNQEFIDAAKNTDCDSPLACKSENRLKSAWEALEADEGFVDAEMEYRDAETKLALRTDQEFVLANTEADRDGARKASLPRYGTTGTYCNLRPRNGEGAETLCLSR